MPAWPGGPCPDCGDNMPPKLIRCATCRALLNADLKPSVIEYPEFVPLREIAQVADCEVRGYLVPCPRCHEELRIGHEYAGKRIACNFCASHFRLDPEQHQQAIQGIYARCPHCEESLRVAKHYLKAKVACRFCTKPIRFVLPPGVSLDS
ncbi:MAG: hypothetical protein KDA90_07215 [Planctomycetaceae bacterium]|nr:hypothetical protein [Planctomycetaceae bacterium]